MGKSPALNITASFDYSVHVHTDCHSLCSIRAWCWIILYWQHFSTPFKPGINPLICPHFPQDPLHYTYASSWCGTELYISCIIKIFFTIVWQDEWSSLMLASQNGHVQVVAELLQHGARVDLQQKVWSCRFLRLGLLTCSEMLRYDQNNNSAKHTGHILWHRHMLYIHVYTSGAWHRL